MIATLFAVLLGAFGDVITVDRDGSADYTSIADAVGAAQDGDVILVMAGAYGAFTVDKELSILGPASGPMPQVIGTVKVAAPRATLAGLEFGVLTLTGASDRVVVDDCTAGTWIPITSESEALVVTDCDEVIVSRCIVEGSKDWQSVGLGNATGTAVRVEASRVNIVDCEFTGGDGASDVGTSPYTMGYPGGAGLVAFDSFVEIAGSRLQAGNGGYGYLGLSDNSGKGGDGLVADDATVVVRGSSTDFVNAGFSLGNAAAGSSAKLTNESLLVISGVHFDASAAQGWSLSFIYPEGEPWLKISGEDDPGAARTIELHGSASDQSPPEPQLALLYLGFIDDLQQFPILEAPMWLDPTHAQVILWVVIEDILNLSLQLPPSLEGLAGLTLHVQAVMPGVDSYVTPDTIVVTNTAPIVVRF